MGERYVDIVEVAGSIPAAPTINMDKLIKLFEEEQFEKVIKGADKELKEQPDNVFLYIIKSKSLTALNKLENAISIYEKALEIFGDNKNIFFELGSVYLDLNKYEKSIEYLEQAVNIDNNYINALNNLGLAYKKSLSFNKAIEVFTKIIDIDSKHFLANYNLSLTHLLNSNRDKALKYIKISNSLRPNFVSIYPVYAKLLISFSKFNEAEQTYKKGLRLDPNNRMLLDGLSNLYLMLGHTSKGLELKYKNTGYYKFNNNIFEDIEEKKSRDITVDNFIGLSKLADINLCYKIINFFEDKKDLHSQGVVGERFDLSVKNSTDLTIHPSDIENTDFFIFKEFLLELENTYKKYIQHYEVLKDFKTIKIPSFNIQKYQKGGHFAKIHCERSDLLTNHRLFAWMCYLNDVENGGETYFKYFDKKYSPEKGNILIWPSEWTHAHSGLEVQQGEKYIVTGWINII